MIITKKRKKREYWRNGYKNLFKEDNQKLKESKSKCKSGDE